MEDTGQKRQNLDFRRRLRKDSTDAENALWRLLRDRQLSKFKFRRQHSFGPYILDFYCPEYRLAIEVDGGQHMEGRQAFRDAVRSEFLETNEVQVLRFTNLEVLQTLDPVLEAILDALGKRESVFKTEVRCTPESDPHPNPLPPIWSGAGSERERG